MCTNSPFFQYMMFLLSAAPSCVLSNIMHMLLMDHWSDLTCLKSLLTKWLKYPTSVLKVIITYAEFTLVNAEFIIILGGDVFIWDDLSVSSSWITCLRWLIHLGRIICLCINLASDSWQGTLENFFYFPHCHYNILSVALFVLLSSALFFSW